MEPLTFALIAAFVILYGVVSNRLQTTIISGPMVFVVFGFILSSDVSGLITSKDPILINIIANLTLMLVLFSDASRISLSLFRREQDLPQRLLGLGLPLTIFAGVLVGLVLLTDLPLWQAAILATILAPTDAALAQAVINSERVPVRIRQALNVESGLNDGICFPILLLFIYLADTSGGHRPASFWIQFIGFQLILGPIIGIVVGYVGGKLVLWSVNKSWMSGNFQRLSIVGVSFMAFFSAEIIGGNGFMSAFFAGLIFGIVARQVGGPIFDFGEAEGELFILLTFMLFGAIMIPNAIGEISWVYILYAVISLTLVRMIPVAISLIGKRLTAPSILYLGWFGPRGVASILYVLVVVDKHDFSGEAIIFYVTTITVLLSILLHGLTAVPGANAYASTLEKIPPENKESEIKEVQHLPTRAKHFHSRT
ncbi:MAG: cation:proton antiporter [Deltaproteobacteria bacterium]|nr:cation:proton antiporter [Deltaproteobacteria bacterium]